MRSNPRLAHLWAVKILSWEPLSCKNLNIKNMTIKNMSFIGHHLNWTSHWWCLHGFRAQKTGHSPFSWRYFNKRIEILCVVFKVTNWKQCFILTPQYSKTHLRINKTRKWKVCFGCFVPFSYCQLPKSYKTSSQTWCHL